MAAYVDRERRQAWRALRRECTRRIAQVRAACHREVRCLRTWRHALEERRRQLQLVSSGLVHWHRLSEGRALRSWAATVELERAVRQGIIQVLHRAVFRAWRSWQALRAARGRQTVAVQYFEHGCLVRWREASKEVGARNEYLQRGVGHWLESSRSFFF